MTFHNKKDLQNKLEDNDLALVIRPLIERKKWNGKVDLCAILMPNTNDISDTDKEIIKDSLYALVACYHLLNTDLDFAKRVNEEMLNLTEEISDIVAGKEGDEIHLSTWTKTEGDVH